MILSWLCLGSSMAQFRSLEPLTDVSDRSYYLNGLQFLGDEIYSFSPEGVSVSKNEGITWDALSFDPKGRYPIFIAKDSLKMGMITSSEPNYCDEIKLHFSNDGGLEWETNTFKIDWGWFCNTFSLTIKDDHIVLTMYNDMYISTDFGKIFKKYDFNGNGNQNQIYHIDSTFYIVDNNHVRKSKNLKNFQRINLPGLGNIENHFVYKNQIVLTDGVSIKIFDGNNLSPFTDFNLDMDFEKTETDGKSIYFYYDEDLVTVDLTTFKKEIISFKNYFSNTSEDFFLRVFDGFVYYFEGNRLYKKSLNSPFNVINISHPFPFFVNAFFYAFDRIWGEGDHLFFADLNNHVWNKSAINRTKYEDFAVTGKDEVLVQRPSPAIYKLYGQKVRNSAFSMDIASLESVGNVLFARHNDGKLYTLHNGILPWIEVSINRVWNKPVFAYSQKKYIIHESNQSIVVSDDGYQWSVLPGKIPEPFISIRVLKNGSFIAISAKNIYLYSAENEKWDKFTTANLPFQSNIFVGLETYDNTVITAVIYKGVFVTNIEDVRWTKWDEGLTDFKFIKSLGGDSHMVLLIGNQVHMRPYIELPATTSVHHLEFAENAIALHPNPAAHLLNIQCDSVETVCRFTISDMCGNNMLESNQHQHQVDISQFPNGMYVVQLHTLKNTYQRTFIVAK